MSENDEIMPTQTGSVSKPSKEPDLDTAQEIHPVRFFNKDFTMNGSAPTEADLETGAYDFRPKSDEHMALVEAEFEDEESDPKDSAVPESASSLKSETTTEIESPASQEPTASVEKDSGQPKASESGQQTSSDPATTGSVTQPAST